VHFLTASSFKEYIYGCTSHGTRRQIKFGDINYEVSLCDLIDNSFASLEFVFDTKQNLIYFKQSKQSAFFIVVLVIFTLLFFIKT